MPPCSASYLWNSIFVLSKINLVWKTYALFVVCLCTGKVGIMLTVWTSTETFPSSSTILRPTASRNSGITHLEALQDWSFFLDSRSSGIIHLEALQGWSSFLDTRSSGIIHLEALQVSSSLLDSRSSGIILLDVLTEALLPILSSLVSESQSLPSLRSWLHEDITLSNFFSILLELRYYPPRCLDRGCFTDSLFFSLWILGVTLLEILTEAFIPNIFSLASKISVITHWEANPLFSDSKAQVFSI